MEDVKLQKGFIISVDEVDKMITPMDIINYFRAIWRQADDYWSERIEPDWNMNEDLYRDKFDVTDKMGWQRQTQVPIVDQLVTRITQFFTRTLVNTFERFVNVKHDNKQKQEAYTEIAKAILRDNRFAEELFPRGLAYSWLNALFITKTYFCTERESYPLWNEEEGRLEYQDEAISRVKIEVVPPRNIRLDPHGDQYIIEIVPDIPLHSFMDMGRKNNWTNIDYVKQNCLYGGATPSEDDPAEVQDTSNHLPTVDLHYVYTQALTDESGDLLCHDVYFIIADRDYVVDFGYNTGIKGKTPYTVHNPMMDVYGRYGRPYISKVRSLIKEYVNLLNLTSDSAILAGLGTHEVNRDLLDSHMAHTVTSDVEPGKLISKRGEGQLISSTYGNINSIQGLLQLLYFYDQQIQNHSYQTEFFDGQNTSRGRKTATEVQTKVQQSNTFFTDIATQIENLSIQPTVEKALFTYLLNMQDDTLKDLSENISDETVRGYFQGLDYAERLADIRGLTIEVKGISGRLQVQNNFNKVLQLLSVMANFGVTQGLTATKLIEKAFEVVDDTPDEFFDMEMLMQAEANMAGSEPSPEQQGVAGQSAQGMDQPPGAQVQRGIAEASPGV